MGYVIVGGVCLMIGGCIGFFTMALVSINRNADRVDDEEAQ